MNQEKIDKKQRRTERVEASKKEEARRAREYEAYRQSQRYCGPDSRIDFSSIPVSRLIGENND